MFVPRLQCAPAARAVVVFTCPFVVEARKVVEHSRACRLWLALRFGFDPSAPVQIVDDAGQSEAGASSVLALIQYQAGLAVQRHELANRCIVRPLLWEADDAWSELAITQIQAIWTRIERPPNALDELRRHTTTLARWNYLRDASVADS